MHSPDVSVIIVNWNTANLLRACLRSIQTEMIAFVAEVIVVDNNSADGSAQMVATEFPEVILIANAQNLGFAKANNQGLEIGTGRYMLLLNPDTVVLDSAIDKMIAFADSKPAAKLGIITSRLLNDDRTLQRSVHKFYSFGRSFLENRFFTDLASKFGIFGKFQSNGWAHDTTKVIDWAYGAVMLFSRDFLGSIGNLDERFYIYAEEMDYFMRAQKAGRDSWFCSEANIVHIGRASTRQRKAAMFIQNYKSFYIFLLKHYGLTDYWLYRLRASIYLVLWYCRFMPFSDQESKANKQVYAETLKWHLSPDSFNLLQAV